MLRGLVEIRGFRQWIGVTVAAITGLFVLGNFSVGLYPYGTAVWVRPLFSLIGLFGVIALIVGSAWWRIVLPVWAAIQTWIIATDRSGEWFNQGLWIGWRNSHSVRNNNVLTEYSASGVNFAGLLLLAIFVGLILLKLHPRIRFPIERRQRQILAAVLASALVVIGVGRGWRWWNQRDALVVIDLDVPFVPIYYQGTLLGRTPLAITREKIAAWGLPLSTSGAEKIRLYSWGWVDAEMITDGATHLPLYAGVPWLYRNDVDTFPTPWGERCRMHFGGDDADRIQIGHLQPAPARRDEPVFQIAVVPGGPRHPGDPLKLHCVVTNPTPREYRGDHVSIEMKHFSYGPRNPNYVPTTQKYKREEAMPADWNVLPPGASKSIDVEFNGPIAPDSYELFCTLNIFSDTSSSTLTTGSVYSNMLDVQTVP